MIRYSLFPLFLAACLTTSLSHAELIGHWTFDEGIGTSTADQSKFMRDANRIGGGGSWILAGPPADGAYDFPGNVSFDVDLSSNLPLGAGERTITAWINPDVQGDRKFLGYGSGSGGTFDFTVEGGGIRFRHGGGNITYGAVPLNDWTHVTMRVPAGAALTGDLDVFINGVEASVTGTGGGGTGVALNTTSSIFRIGRANAFFDGQIDDVQFYDNALTEKNISFLYANPGVSIPEPSAVVLTALMFLGFGLYRYRFARR